MLPSDPAIPLRASGTAYRIGARGADPLPIPDGGLPLSSPAGVRLLPGWEAPDFRDGSLSDAADLVARIAPWAVIYMAPGWEGPGRRCDGPLTWAGTAWPSLGVAIVNSGRRGPLLLGTLLHELWHLCEPRLSVADQVALTEPLLAFRGVAWRGDYNASREECLARAFASYASARVLEGFEVHGVPTFDRVLAGELAGRVAA